MTTESLQSTEFRTPLRQFLQVAQDETNKRMNIYMNTRFIALWIKKMNLLINAVLLKNINMQPHDISLHPDRMRKPVSILDDLLPSLIVRNLHLISNLTDQTLPEKPDKNEIRLDDENIACKRTSQ